MSRGARCDLCPLAKHGIPVFPSYSQKSWPVGIVVGEGPGRNEEKLGLPFVGQSGKLLDFHLARNKIPRKNLHVTNATLCRPGTENKKILRKAAECCGARLYQEIAPISKSVPILALGKQATISILGLTQILLVRGFIFETPLIDPSETKKLEKAILKHAPKSIGRLFAEFRRDWGLGRAAIAGRPVLPTIHPAFVLRSETWSGVLKLDMRRFARMVRGEIGDLADQVKLPETVTQDVRKLKILGPEVSLDVETTKTGSPLTASLLCVGLSDGKREIVIWPWKAKLARPVADFLKTRKSVVGHNTMNFDRVVLERHGIK